MSGKKSSKNRITIGFLCNATGTEKWPLFYIAKYKKPRCFGKKTPNEHGFYYQNNKTSWMTAAFFEEYVRCSTEEYCKDLPKVPKQMD
jgi:hypothetical protein